MSKHSKKDLDKTRKKVVLDTGTEQVNPENLDAVQRQVDSKIVDSYRPKKTEDES